MGREKMPKRKRSAAEDFEKSFERFNTELFRALKTAKGFERQRLAKRVKDVKLGQEKIQRLEQEIEVLKALDLHQAAQAHLCSALLKVKAAAQSPLLPETIRNGVPKPDISEEERHALHNVTSTLYKRKQVRDVITTAIPALCQCLGVSPPGEKSKAKAKTESSSSTKTEANEVKATKKASSMLAAEAKKQTREALNVGQSSSGAELGDGSDGELDDDAIDRMEAMLGGSSSEDEDDDKGGVALTHRPAHHYDPDDISLPGSDSDPEEELSGGDEVSIPSWSSGSEADMASESEKRSPPTKKTKEKRGRKKAGDDIIESVALPTLMGGYISGSEAASDVDVAPAPRKNRRGQKARQAIAEKKYGDKAKHLGKQKEAGWDPKRGAVDAAQDGKPWKKGTRNPLKQEKVAKEDKSAKKPEKKGRDDDGPLHPSWLAKKKAKQAQENASFQGKKITFD